jgi:hypothetical protein
MALNVCIGRDTCCKYVSWVFFGEGDYAVIEISCDRNQLEFDRKREEVGRW